MNLPQLHRPVGVFSQDVRGFSSLLLLRDTLMGSEIQVGQTIFSARVKIAKEVNHITHHKSSLK